MGDFTFTSTAQCEICGAHLSSSDEECDHNGEEVETLVFRRLNGGRDTLIGVKTIRSKKWEQLKEEVGDDWIAYQFLGSKEQVNSMLTSSMWDGVSELPRQSMSISAPEDLYNPSD